LGVYPPSYARLETIMADTEKITITNFNDFKKQLTALKEDSTTSALISFFKYCWLHDAEYDFNFYRELIEDELEEFGLKEYQYRVTAKSRKRLRMDRMPQ